MTNNELQIKVKQRLNKLASGDYDNLECWQITEAFNRAQLLFVRSLLRGYNLPQIGDEGSKFTIDDLEPLIEDLPISVTDQGIYYATSANDYPEDFNSFKRLSAKGTGQCCTNKPLVLYDAREADVDVLLRDPLRSPSIEWGETFFTRQGNTFKIFTNDLFDISDVVLTYYRNPVNVAILNCVDLNDNPITTDVECEFKEDVCELLISYTAAILAGDIESLNQYGIMDAEKTKNT